MAARASCFNPRARVGRDGAGHARQGVAVHVSIHAPAWGATRPACRACRRPCCFNPRARVGRDLPDHALEPLDRFVSIHAPVRGATPAAPRNRCLRARFNPRARAGRDPDTLEALCAQHCFNPRARVGRDHRRDRDGACGVLVSIHAPAWGATTMPAHCDPVR